MDSIKSILKDQDHNQPKDIGLLKEYILKNYHQEVEVSIKRDTLVLKINSSSLASILRMHLIEIKRVLKITKNIQIIIY